MPSKLSFKLWRLSRSVSYQSCFLTVQNTCRYNGGRQRSTIEGASFTSVCQSSSNPRGATNTMAARLSEAELTQLSHEDLLKEVIKYRDMYDRERRRSCSYQEELRVTKEQNLAVQKQVEQEEEFITNKLMKRLDQLKREKQTLVNEVEQEEEYLTNNLQKRLEKLNREKGDLENKLEMEQEYITNRLQKKLDELTSEKLKLQLEKVNLENQLEAEQEYIVHKLQKQVEKLASEKRGLQREKSDLQRQVSDLGASVEKLNREKVQLENSLEMEEEGIVNRLQRQLEHMTSNFKLLESRLESRGISLKDLGPFVVDSSTEWVYGRSPSRSGDYLRVGSRRERSLSGSSTSSLRHDMLRPEALKEIGVHPEVHLKPSPTAL